MRTSEEVISVFAEVFARCFPGVRPTPTEIAVSYYYVMEHKPKPGTSNYQSFYNLVRKTGERPRDFQDTMVREFWREIGRREYGRGSVVAGTKPP